MSEHLAPRPALSGVTILALLLNLLATLTVTQPVAAAASGLFAELEGAAEVPGPGDDDGFGFTSLSIDPAAGEVCGFLEVIDISAASAAHIHEGAAGAAGGIVVTLPTPGADGVADGCVGGLDQALLQSIVDNPSGFYVNVHNADFPDGALRGQLHDAPTSLFMSLDGASEVPGPGDPDGSGFGSLDFSVDIGQVCGFLQVSDIAAATAAHIHLGAEGVAGAVVVTLATPDADGIAEGCVDGLDPVLLQTIIDNPAAYYVNVHNAEFPDGAIRGQLMGAPTPLFYALDGASEVPGPGDPDGVGSGVLDFFIDGGQICGFMEVSGIGAATAAHIHAGVEGVAGPVVVTLLTPNSDGLAEGCVGDLDPVLMQAIVDNPAGYYVNVHNAEFPDGAIRGQLSAEPPPPPSCQPGQLCNGLLAPGTYTYTGFGTDVTFTTATEWFFIQDDIPSMSLVDFEAGGGLFGFPFTGQVFADPCDFDSVTTIGDSPAELMAWLTDRSFLDATDPTAVEYGGATGLQIDIVASPPPECVAPPWALVFSLPIVGDFHFEEGSVARIVALDVAGETILFIAEAFPGGDSATFLANAQGVLDSLDWALPLGPGVPQPTATPRPRAGTLPDTGMIHAEPLGGAPLAGLVLLVLSLGAYGLVAARRRGLLARPSR